MRYVPYCSLCGLCENYNEARLSKICPRIKKPSEVKNHGLGNYRKILLAKGKYKGTYSGAIVSTLIIAKKEGLIDGVLGVEKGKTIIQPKPKYAKTEEDIKRLLGMRHTISSHLSILNKIPTEDKIALVGLPCHIEAVYNLRKRNLLHHNVKYLIGIACGTNYEYNKFHDLIRSYGIDLERVSYYTLRDTEKWAPYFLFVLDNGKQLKLPVSRTVDCISKGCIYCNDYLGYHSDLSFGVLGAPKGWSLIFIRNQHGQHLIDVAVEKGYLEVKEISQNFISKLVANFYRILPTKLYLPIAFKTKNPIGAELMAKFKIYYLNKRLKDKFE